MPVGLLSTHGVSDITAAPVMLQGATGAFPERGLSRAKTLPDAYRASRDSGVTRSVTRFV